jgi:hypothetical protein
MVNHAVEPTIATMAINLEYPAVATLRLATPSASETMVLQSVQARLRMGAGAIPRAYNTMIVVQTTSLAAAPRSHVQTVNTAVLYARIVRWGHTVYAKTRLAARTFSARRLPTTAKNLT